MNYLFLLLLKNFPFQNSHATEIYNILLTTPSSTKIVYYRFLATMLEPQLNFTLLRNVAVTLIIVKSKVNFSTFEQQTSIWSKAFPFPVIYCFWSFQTVEYSFPNSSYRRIFRVFCRSFSANHSLTRLVKKCSVLFNCKHSQSTSESTLILRYAAVRTKILYF